MTVDKLNDAAIQDQMGEVQEFINFLQRPRPTLGRYDRREQRQVHDRDILELLESQYPLVAYGLANVLMATALPGYEIQQPSGMRWLPVPPDEATIAPLIARFVTRPDLLQRWRVIEDRFKTKAAAPS